VKSFIVVLSALLLLVVAACHLYRAYAGIHVVVGTHDIPILWSWVAGGVTGVLGLLLLVVRK
jgi:hypothetical protein